MSCVSTGGAPAPLGRDASPPSRPGRGRTKPHEGSRGGHSPGWGAKLRFRLVVGPDILGPVRDETLSRDDTARLGRSQ
jgi:hypothetical protein